MANSGEIAIRVFRTLRELGIGSVAVYSTQTGRLGTSLSPTRPSRSAARPPAESYLDVAKLLEAARSTGAEAIHPGYGFLAENAGFARAVEDAGLVWIGPPPDAIELMGHKIAARDACARPASRSSPARPSRSTRADAVVRLGDELGYPAI